MRTFVDLHWALIIIIFKKPNRQIQTDKSSNFISPVKIGLYSQITLVFFCPFVSLIFKTTFIGSYWDDFLFPDWIK